MLAVTFTSGKEGKVPLLFCQVTPAEKMVKYTFLPKNQYLTRLLQELQFGYKNVKRLWAFENGSIIADSRPAEHGALHYCHLSIAKKFL